VYERLGYAYIEPELREGTGELRAAREGELPVLVELGDIRGDLHSHTTLSDGKNSLEEMAEAARARRYSYLAITDHSATHGFGDDVTAERLWERIEEVHTLDSKLPRFHLLAGSEINIGTDGSLDYPEDLVAALDWVIASVHTSFSNDEKLMTGRVLEAIENPLVDCIGHLTGRMLLRREPYPINVELVAQAAARTGTMLEINGNPNRRDLSERHARLAAEAGAMIVLNTDAHRVSTLDNMQYGLATARRAWLTKDQIANTRGWREFARLRKRSRQRSRSTSRNWGSTPAERELAFPCDRYLHESGEALFRAIDVDAPASIVFRWLCQLRVAPYSYDWIDNRGRRSPRALTPGLEELAEGQRVMTIFELAEFEPDRQLTLRLRNPRLLRDLAVTYLVVPAAEQRSRLLVKMLVAFRGGQIGAFAAGNPLALGDLVMMRRQLLNLKQLAEQTAAAERAGRV